MRRCPSCFDLSPLGARELLQAASIDEGPCYLAQLATEILETAQICATDLADDYCASIHPWLPVIDPEHLRSWLVSWPHSSDAELAPLIWALYLVTRRPCMSNGHSMCSMLYQSIRQMFVLRASIGATLKTLQAGLLITYYACGHGLPRDAHVTLATCVTVARLMGFDFEGSNYPASPNDPNSVCWWAMILLDRYVTAYLIINLRLYNEDPPERWHYQVSTIQCP